MSVIRIEVTADDIARGICDPKACPVALAMLRAGLPHASVDGVGLGWCSDPDWADFVFNVPCPGEVSEFVAAFDGDYAADESDEPHRDAVVPFSFVIDLDEAEVLS